MNATLSVRASDRRAVIVSIVVAVVGLLVMLASVSLGQIMADGAVRAAGGSLDSSRYLLVMQLNADAARLAGAVLLAVGTFVGLRRL